MRMLPSTLRRYGSDRPFEYLQQRLLYTLSGNITCDRCILRLSRNLVDLININDTMLCFFDIIVCCLNDLEQNIFHILAHISGLRQRGRICDCKRYIQQSRQGLCQHRLSGTSRPKHQNIALLYFHIQIFSAHDTLVVIVHSHRQRFFRLILSDDVFIQKILDLHRFLKIDRILPIRSILFIHLFLYDL